MLYGKALQPSAFAVRRFHTRGRNCLFALGGMVVWLACWWLGPRILAVLFLLSLTVILFMIRIDIAFYIVIALWMTLIALPLPIASPFTPGAMADLPLYEVFTPLLGFCLVARIAMRKERVSNSPLKIPMLAWFGLIGLTYLRNPVFLGDLFGKSGTGSIYHIVYPLLLCAIFYLSAASILKTVERITLTAKIVFVIMFAGMILMTFMLLTGWNIPFLTGGRGPWTIKTYTDKGETVFRIGAMSSYSAMLFLALLCFGSNLWRPLQVLISLLLAVTLVIGGGRSALATILMFALLSLIVMPRTRWLIGCLSLLAICFALIVLPRIELPYTTRRIVTLSTESGIGIGGRASMARVTWNVVKKRPLVGIGYGQFGKYSADIPISDYARGHIASGDPHSGFLAIMMAYGLVGLGVFLWLILTAIKTGWRLYRITEDSFLKQLMLWTTLHLTTMLVLFFVSGQIERTIVFYLEMGVIGSIYAVYSEKGALSDIASRGLCSTSCRYKRGKGSW